MKAKTANRTVPAPAPVADVDEPWTCDDEDCGAENLDHDPRCMSCPHGSRPDLMMLDRMLLWVVGDTPEKAARFEKLRTLHSVLGDDEAILNELLAVLREIGGDVCTVNTAEGPVCWEISRRDVQMWFDEESPPNDRPGLGQHRLVEMVRDLYRIPRRGAKPAETANPSGNGIGKLTLTPEQLNGQPRKEKPKRGERPKLSKAVGQSSAPARVKLADADVASPSISMISIDRIVARHNPREHFDEEKLEQLAASIRVHGLLQPIVVLPSGKDGLHELLDGERRFRASQRAGLKVVPATIRACDQVEAAKVRLIANFIREGLNPIEEAKAFRSILAEGVSQQELADELQLTQAHISNRARMLDLPEAWQQRVITQEISASQARVLLPWAARPTLMKLVEESLEYRKKYPWQGEATVSDFEEWVNDALNESTREMDKTQHGGPKFKPTEEQLEQLDVVEYKEDKQTVRVAFNVALWDELQKAAEKKADDRRAKRAESDGESAAAPDLSPEEKKKRAKKQREQLEKKVAAWRTRWYQDRIGENLPHADLSLLMLGALQFAAQEGYSDRRDELIAAIGEAGGTKAKNRTRGYSSSADVWSSLMSVPGPKIQELLRTIVTTWWQHETEGWRCDVDPRDVEELAKELRVDLKKHWRVDRSFLQLFTKAQLLAMAEEWNILLHAAWRSRGRIEKRDEVIEAVLAVDQVKRLPVPKCLLKV